MEKNDYNIQQYIDTETKYINHKSLIKILEDNMSFDELKKSVEEAQVLVTEEEIIKFLGQTLREENPDLEIRMNNYKNRIREHSVANVPVRQNFEYDAQNFVDKLKYAKYRFEPYTLEYFKKYVLIVREKSLLLLSIIEKIGNNDIKSIQNQLENLDIQLNENGDISSVDAIRLITPTIHNIKELFEFINRANDLSTYLSFKMSKDSLYRAGLSEDDLYPNKTLQVKNLEYEYFSKSNVPLSEAQKEKLLSEQRANTEFVTNLMRQIGNPQKKFMP